MEWHLQGLNAQDLQQVEACSEPQCTAALAQGLQHIFPNCYGQGGFNPRVWYTQLSEICETIAQRNAQVVAAQGNPTVTNNKKGDVNVKITVREGARSQGKSEPRPKKNVRGGVTPTVNGVDDHTGGGDSPNGNVGAGGKPSVNVGEGGKPSGQGNGQHGDGDDDQNDYNGDDQNEDGDE